MKQLLLLLLLLHIAVASLISDVEKTNQQHQDATARVKRQAPEGDSNGWGDWGPWSICSHSCGIGVRHKERTCHQTRGEEDNCLGSSKMYELCNTQDCPKDSPDSRTEQCQNYREVAYGPNTHTWIPFYGAEDKCELNCIAEGETFYFSFASRVLDGTRCEPGSLNICVSGICRNVGCDRVLDSNKVLDKCAVCDGDGSTCETKDGVLYTDDLIIGYNDLLEIPAGATGLTIEEEGRSSIFFALRNLDGKYHLSGDWHVDNPGKYEVGGTVFSYDRIEEPTYGPQILRAEGPTTEALVLVALSQKSSDVNPSIHYEYSESILDRPQEVVAVDQYRWQAGSWAECSRSCAVGYRGRSLECVDQNGESVQDGLCEQESRPAVEENCNVQACPASWHTGQWQDCSTSCTEGVQERNVYCQALQQGDIYSIVEDDFCHPEPKPISMQPCNMDVECPEWITSAWSSCNRMCGDGEQSRRVTCAGSECDVSTKPASHRGCNVMSCEGAEWIVSEWQGCPDNCEGGVESRVSICASQTGEQVDESRCDTMRPVLQRPCPQGDDCVSKPKWYASEWSMCSAKCGAGIQSRSVVCTIAKDQTLSMVDDEQCNSELKMSSQQNCTGTHCAGMWFAAPFGKCSAVCGGGQQRREILCFSDGQVATADDCDANTQPAEFADCNQHACDDDDLLGGCQNSPYGCCLDGKTPADGPNFLNCPQEDPVPAGSCIEADFGCCLDGMTAADGPFLEGCPEYTCKSSEFGCCYDGQTPLNADGSGCPEDSYDCSFSTFGCCPDAVTAAEGPNDEGCNNVVLHPKAIVDVLCGDSMYGCCADGVSTAKGADGEGCEEEEIVEEEKEEEKEEGSGEGSCQGSGCSGSGEVESSTVETCSSSAYGCCPDGVTSAAGDNWLGCDVASGSASGEEPVDVIVDCSDTDYGCCPDEVSAASGPGYEGCDLPAVDCDVTAYGCCPDGETTSQGLNYEGCPEEGTYVFSCTDSAYGCCPDGISSAAGPNGAGCPSVVQKRASCGEASDRGPCSNYTVRWAFDAAHGDCTRFWYGGCEGNDNNFATQELCKQNCMEPEDELAACYLPKSVGRCRALVAKFYYDATTRQCEQFNYGGCLGNANRFETREECEQRCVIPQVRDTCSQPYLPGPCRGQFDRWFYDKAEDKCRRFMYGGCKGNGNRFTTEEACQQRCMSPPETVCRLARDAGPCEASYERWYFEADSGMCVQFEYGGCDGNANRFSSKEECKRTCHSLLKTKVDICTLPQEAGSCTDYYERWYFDNSDGYCKQFVYGGCEGNENQFESEQQCRTRCNAKLPVDICKMEKVVGPCRAWTTRYYFNVDTGRCERFHYGGCDGNGNNFATAAECGKTCEESYQDRCLLPQEAGRCLTYLRRYYYDSAKGSCMMFIYGGCGGNRNRFLSQEQCAEACETDRRPVTTPLDTCEQEKDSGECLAYHPMWYYERSINKCQQFVYGGCGGNDNRFETQQVCEERCIQPRETEHARTGLAVCSLRRESGHCSSSVTKWYYDIESASCKKFLYTNCGGNENRFRSREECENACPVADICSLSSDMGPCLATKRRYFYNSASRQCEEFVYGGCGGNANRFLSISSCQAACRPHTPAEVISTTPEVELDTCSKQRDSGPCRNYHLKWYYDSREERCTQFVYGGCGGNDNRFATEEECEQRCVGDAKRTAVVVDTWPTTAATTTTEYVSPERESEACRQEKDMGNCAGYHIFWYYDQLRFRCHRFRYTGCGGNSNRFRTQQECQRRCAPGLPREEAEPDVTEGSTEGSTSAVEIVEVTTSGFIVEDDVCELVQDMGSCYDYVIKWYFDSSIGRCRRFYYGGCDGNGNRFDNMEQCNKACVERHRTDTTEEVTTVCKMQRDAGPCQAWQPRWYFDDASGTCARFQYGGCDGNENNFETEWECLKSCGRRETKTKYEPKSRNVCAENKDPGPCYADMLRFYFDVSIGICRPFTYGGCQGNGNNFRTQEECYSVCTRQPNKYEDTIVKPADCFEASDPGNCNAAEPRWYFDSTQGDCVGFYYGGCNGNRNNFRSYDDCLAFCSKVPTNCGVLTCDLQCSMGYARGIDGCLECRCLDPCENYQCSPSTQCEVETVVCVKEPCPGPKPVCKPIEAPVILEMMSKYTAGEGDHVVITCRSRAAPAPQVTWYKNRQPLEVEMRRDGRPVQLSDGSLEFTEVRRSDAGLYTCRVYNSVGAATQTFTLDIQVPVQMSDGPEAVHVRVGQRALLQCSATGSPPPQIRWIRDGRLVFIDGEKMDQRADGSLAISDSTRDDTGDYTCEAINGVGQASRRVIMLDVRDVLSVSFDEHTTSYKVGDAMRLVCRVFGDHNVVPRWSKDSGAVSSSLVHSEGAISHLSVSSLRVSDAGEYTCTAQRDDDITSVSTTITVKGDGLPEGCVDKPWYANCRLIVEADYCTHPYFSVFCCKSCYQAGKLQS